MKAVSQATPCHRFESGSTQVPTSRADEMLISLERKEYPPFATSQIDLEGTVLSVTNQAQRADAV